MDFRPKKAYKIIFNALSSNGQLYVHQGGKNTYMELHEAAKKVLCELSLDKNFIGWKFPAIYLTDKELEELLIKIGFKSINITQEQYNRNVDENLINDFIVSSLRAYMEKVPIEKRTFFTERFNEYCLTNVFKVKVTRLYITARKP